MFQVAFALIALACCHTVLAANINPYTDGTGPAKYDTYLPCVKSTMFFPAPEYDAERATYTPRDNFDCCYYADSRNTCCVKKVTASDGTSQNVCHCDPTITCGIPTTTEPTTTMEPTTTTLETTTMEATTMETTTMETTTPAFTSLCTTPTVRVLNGIAADQCSFPGIGNITTQGGTISSCNVVYTTATVNGVKKEVFVTADVCRQMVDQLIQISDPRLSIGKQNYTMNIFNRIQGSDGIAFFEIQDDFLNLFADLGSCQLPACGYDSATMSLDFTDCKLASFGANDSATLTQKGLHEVALQENKAGCTDITLTFGAANTMCFETQSGQNLYCSGDSGAPVYCKAPENGEWILVGVAMFQPGCDKSPEVRVIPFPG